LNRFTKVFLRTILWIVGGLITLILLLIFLIRLPSVQNYLVKEATHYLEQKIGTPVSIGYVNITFPKKIVLERVYFADQNRDTLIAGEKLKVDIDMFKIFQKTIKVQELDLEGITSTIKRDSSGNFNFDYILKAFTSEKKKESVPDTSSSLLFDIGKVNLDRVHFAYTDDMIGLSADVRLNHFDTKVKTFDLEKNMSFNLPKIIINGLIADVKQWSPSTPQTAIKVENLGIANANTSSLLPELATEVIQLTDILVKYNDSSAAIDTKFDIKNLNALVETIDLNKEVVKLKELDLNQSSSHVILSTFGKPVI